ncbi:MAG: aminotransferase class III-fold pyridoxal phosphate-dependent enzyme, partial [Candidatus Aerophobus sp.]
KEYLVRLKELCDKYDIVLVVDEIQTGMGRTGKMWACEHSGIAPDLVTVAKTLGGGIALSALVGREEILDSWGPAAHLGTFSGNALACAAANKVLEIMERDNIPARAAEKGVYFLDGLKQIAKAHPLVVDADGIGLYLSLEFVKNRKTKEPAKEETGFMASECLKEGLVCEHTGYYFNRFNLIPSLLIEKEEIDRALDILDRVIARAEGKFGYR